MGNITISTRSRRFQDIHGTRSRDTKKWHTPPLPTPSGTPDPNIEFINWQGRRYLSKRPLMPDSGVSPQKSQKIAYPSTYIKRVSGIATRGIINYKLTKTLPEKTPTSKPYLPPDIGNSAKQLALKANTVRFFQTCVEARVPHELNKLPPSTHPDVTILKHMQVHGLPITAKRGMAEQEFKIAIQYGSRSSATMETTFVRTKLAEQARAGHITPFPQQAVSHLP